MSITLLRENLAEAGYQVVGVSNGEAGVQQAKAIHPFAITLVLMPHKDGWQVLHELKRDPATRDNPVILLTIVDKKTLGYQLGAADYLVKPFDQATLLAALNALAPRLPLLDDHHAATHLLLVVDDDPDVIDLVRQWLTTPEYVVDAAADGLAALAAVGRQAPDIILLDLLMPHLDGFGVIEQLRQDPATQDLPIIVLTAKTLATVENVWLQTRVAQVIQKEGFAGETLAAELHKVLQAQQAQEQKSQ